MTGATHNIEDEQLPVMLPSNKDKPVVTCIVGSTRYPLTLQKAEELLTMAGKIVLSVGIVTRANHGMDSEDFFKTHPWEGLDDLHFKKILMANEVLVVNPEGYIGRSGAREICFALWAGKPVFYWEGQPYVPIPQGDGIDGGDARSIESCLLLYSVDTCGREAHISVVYNHSHGVCFCCAYEAAEHGFYPQVVPTIAR